MPEEVPAGSALTVAARRDLYGDAFNEEVLMRPGQVITGAWWRSTTRRWTARRTDWRHSSHAVSDGLRQVQTGFARSYALSMLAGTVLVVATILAVNLW